MCVVRIWNQIVGIWLVFFVGLVIIVNIDGGLGYWEFGIVGFWSGC